MKKSFQEDFAFLKWPTPGTPCPASRTSKRCKTPANVGYSGSYSVPALWERKKKTIVSNDSVGIMRSLSTSFDEFLEPRLRVVNKPVSGLRPQGLAGEIDQLGARIEGYINWGTYKCGMAASQADYDECMKRLFGIMGEPEERLGGSKSLFGDHITETDIR